MAEPKANKGVLWRFRYAVLSFLGRVWYAILSCFGVQRNDAREKVPLLSSATEKKIEEEDVQVEGQLEEEIFKLPPGVVLRRPVCRAVLVSGTTRDFAEQSAKRTSRHPARPLQGNTIPTAGGPQTRSIRNR